MVKLSYNRGKFYLKSVDGMIKQYTNENVYEALLRRLRFIFEEFENIYVSFSGGKDSGLLLNLLLDFRSQYYPDRQMLVMNVPSADLTMLSTDAGAHLGKIDLVVPFSQTLRNQYLEGTLVMPTHDRKYMHAIKAAVGAVR